MNKILLIIQREYLTRVRKRLFLITTILAPLSIVVIIGVSVLIAKYSSDLRTIGVIDKSKDSTFLHKLSSDDKVQFIYLNEDFETAKKNYKKENLSGILYISPSYSMFDTINNAAEYYSEEQAGVQLKEAIATEMSKVTQTEKLHRLNLTQLQKDDLEKEVQIKDIVNGPGGEKEGNTEAATAIGYAMGFIIYIVMILYGSLVMRGVMEEKTNRIAEVMVSSVKPFQLMMGKIIGIGMVGLTQFVVWIVLITVFSIGISTYYGGHIPQQTSVMPGQSMMLQPAQHIDTNTPAFAKEIQKLSTMPWGIIISCFLFFFIAGYLLYASLFAAVGAAAGDEGDQSLTFIVTLPVIISIMIMVNSIRQPNGTLATVASMIPFSAPIVMCARLPFHPHPWQIIVSMLSLIAGFVCTTWMAGKIYRTGILMYGKKTTFRELIKWVTYKN